MITLTKTDIRQVIPESTDIPRIILAWLIQRLVRSGLDPPPASLDLWRFLARITEKPATAASFCICVVAEKITFRHLYAIRGENL
jgi:hypothetical protein